MRFFWTFFWLFLLVQMLTYVVGSMNGVAFDMKLGTILAVAVTILVFVVSSVIPNEPVEKH